ncbi:DUF721 domain-containing protein [Streptomyces sp. NPDC051555]|uniref:DUF721 domain-containing protein n=1 Tax=Streptomyces sp. NPDC051555 TaxID=3365657 RepID=UPI00378D6D81
MSAEPELSGIDLARQALLAAREAAKRNGATSKKPRRRAGTAAGRDGREPLGLGSAISRMMTERGMVAPAVGGSVLAAFDTILAVAVPELAGRVEAVAFNADNGRLDLVPNTPACGTQLRWNAPKLITTANEKVPGANVRALHVLAPAPLKACPVPATAGPMPQPTTPAAPVKRRPPPEGHQRAIEAHRQAALRSLVDPHIAEAVERQNRALRELSRQAFPEPDATPADALAPIDGAVLQQRREFTATETAALHRARAERAQRSGATVILPGSTPLRSTA